jgi:nucleoprotein TPR
VSKLEQTIQFNSSSAATTRIRIQNLEQELDLAKKNGEWYQSELKAKQEEYMKYRKEKGTKVAELQRVNEDVSSTVDALKRTETTLRNRLTEVEQKFEESLHSIQQLQEDATKAEENHRLEIDRTNRLAQLQEKSAATEKRRVQEFQEALEQAKDEAAEEIGRVRAEVETEHAERQAAEERIAELEQTVARLEGEISELQARPMTPVRGMNGAGSNASSRAGTPSRAFSPSSSRMKGSLSMTQMYSEYSTMKSQLIKEQRNSEQYKATIDDMIQDLEALKPEVEGLRTRNASLLEEMNQMSSLLDSYAKDKDAARKEARKAENQIRKVTEERDIFKQQVVDLSAQARYLVMQNHVLKQGENLTQADIAELEKAAEDQIQQQDLDGLSDTGRIISERLVVFKNITELQERNVEITRMLRQLSEQMESAEAREKEKVYQQEHSELLDLRGQIQGFKDEAKAMNLRADGYLKERDMYRRLLSKRGQLPRDGDGSSIFGQDSVPATPTGNNFGSPSSKDIADYTKLIKEMQNHFDAFRQESQTNMHTLKEQNDVLSREKGSLQADVARVAGQLSLANQRNEMLQGNYTMLRAENDMLQKRTQTMMENATKQDLRTQQAVEELVETKSLMDSMRNETSNLKAEKAVWKTVEQRLLEDNENLRNERNKQITMNSNLQLLNNEQKQADVEIRRRQQTQIENLESDLQSTRRKLNDEIEEAKKMSLRKDYDQQQSQKRIDDLMTALGNTREELAGAKTTRDHLQARVDELEIEMKSAEERIAALQPKLAGEESNRQNSEDQAQDALSREQELALEVSELKRDLELAKSEVERAKEQVEQYQNISQNTEEQLQSLNETTDQYREETDHELAEKDKKIKDLQQRIEDIESELAASNTDLSKLQDEQSELNRQISQQKAEFETEIARLKDEDEQHALMAKFHQENLKAQAEIAQKAQQDYEDELVKHSDATQQLRTIRAEANELKATVVDLRSTAGSAKATLAQKEESWAEIRDRYDADIAELKNRKEEVQHQNDLLHGQLEAIGRQIAALKQDRASLTAAGMEAESDNLDLAALQEVIAYLRREKAIIEVQYDIVQSDVKRLQRDFDHANAQLDDLRVKMSQDHRRDAEIERNALDHNKLLETINELNLYRESSVTLRNEARRAEASLAEKSKLIDDLRQQIQPLQARVQELENVNETQAGEMKLLQEDRDRWRERTNNIMSKYDRVDPAELESLKTQIETLTTERDEAVAAKSPLLEQVNTLQEQVKENEEKWQSSRAKLVEQFKARSRELSAKINAGVADLQAAIAEKESLQQQLDASKKSLEDLKLEHSQELGKAVTEAASQTSPTWQVDTVMQNGIEEGEVSKEPVPEAPSEQVKLLEETISQLEEKLRTAEAKADAEAARADALQREVDNHVAEITELNRQIVSTPYSNIYTKVNSDV